MKWTTEQPTVPGWYWHRSGKQFMPNLAFISAFTRDGKRFCLYHTGVYEDFCVENIPGQWAGPIPEPEE